MSPAISRRILLRLMGLSVLPGQQEANELAQRPDDGETNSNTRSTTTLSGNVVDAMGEPVAGASVNVFDQTADSPQLLTGATSDAKGALQLSFEGSNQILVAAYFEQDGSFWFTFEPGHTPGSVSDVHLELNRELLYEPTVAFTDDGQFMVGLVSVWRWVSPASLSPERNPGSERQTLYIGITETAPEHGPPENIRGMQSNALTQGVMGFTVPHNGLRVDYGPDWEPSLLNRFAATRGVTVYHSEDRNTLEKWHPLRFEKPFEGIPPFPAFEWVRTMEAAPFTGLSWGDAKNAKKEDGDALWSLVDLGLTLVPGRLGTALGLMIGISDFLDGVNAEVELDDISAFNPNDYDQLLQAWNPDLFDISLSDRVISSKDIAGVVYQLPLVLDSEEPVEIIAHAEWLSEVGGHALLEKTITLDRNVGLGGGRTAMRGAGWPMYWGGPTRTRALKGAPGPTPPINEKWRFEVEAGPSGFALAVTEDTVYFLCGNEDRKLYAINVATGAERWRSEGANSFSASLAVDNDTLYVGSMDGPVYAIDIVTGKERWRFEGATDLTAGPAVVGDSVYVFSFDTNIYAIDAATGAERWRFDEMTDTPWVPAVADDTLYVGSADTNLYAIDTVTGDERWRYEKARARMWMPAVADGTVYVGSDDATMYAINSRTGNERWRYDRMTSPPWTPLVADSTLFTGSEEGFNLVAIDTATGNERWHLENGYSLAAAGDTLYYTRRGETFLDAIDVATGAQRWHYGDLSVSLVRAAVADSTLFGVNMEEKDEDHVYSLHTLN